jgi:dolichol-phosphate mannosyltransferase
VIDALLARLEPVCEAAAPGSYEIVLVNDGSHDGTWAAIGAHAARSPHIVGIDLSRNHGHQLALTAGLSLCRGNHVLVIDADLQDPPELLPEMLALAGQGYDVVYGQRIDREGETWFKKSSASLFYRLLERLIDIPIPRDTGDFRLMSRAVVDAFNRMPERHRFVRGMVSWLGFRQVALPYVREARFAGKPITRWPGWSALPSMPSPASRSSPCAWPRSSGRSAGRSGSALSSGPCGHGLKDARFRAGPA